MNKTIQDTRTHDWVEQLNSLPFADVWGKLEQEYPMTGTGCSIMHRGTRNLPVQIGLDKAKGCLVFWSGVGDLYLFPEREIDYKTTAGISITQDVWLMYPSMTGAESEWHVTQSGIGYAPPLQIPSVDGYQLLQGINHAITDHDLRDRLQQLRVTEDTMVADRIEVLFDPESYFDGDEALSTEAALGFLDFIDRIDREGIEFELSSALGRLCSEWRTSDGRTVVLWFHDRKETKLTIFDADGTRKRDIGQDPRSRTATEVLILLIEQGIFR